MRKALKKVIAMGAAAAMAVSMTACGSKPAETTAAATEAAATAAAGSEAATEAAPAENVKIDTLNIGFVPSRDAEQIITATEPLKQMVKDTMANHGYDIGNVEITVGTSFEAVGEALAAGSLDIGFVSGGTYVQYSDDTTPVLTATRAGLTKDFSDAKEWNDGKATERDSSSQVTYYKGLIIAGPSEKGQELAAKINNGEELTWEDISSARWAVGNTSSNAGYVYPCLWLNEKYGKMITDLPNVTPGTAYATAVAQLAAEQIDVTVGYADLRDDYVEKWTTEMNRTAPIWEETNVIAVTPDIFNDVVIASNTSDTTDEAFNKAFQDSMIEIAGTDEGKEVISIYSHEGYLPANASDYEATRAAQELLKSLN